MKNTERRNANICLSVMGVGMAALILPVALGADMMQWGYGVSFVGGFVALSFLIIHLLFRGRAKVMDRMFSENVLAHWTYSKTFWDRSVDGDRDKTVIFKLFGAGLGVVFLLIGIGVFLAGAEDGGPFLGIMAGMAVFFIVVGQIAAWSAKKRVASALPEAIITRDGLYFKKVLYTWNSRRIAYLVTVDMDPVEPASLLFEMRQLQGGGRFNVARYQALEISVPIPPGEEKKAEAIIRFFGLPSA